jgi:hypothetical protein
VQSLFSSIFSPNRFLSSSYPKPSSTHIPSETKTTNHHSYFEEAGEEREEWVCRGKNKRSTKVQWVKKFVFELIFSGTFFLRKIEEHGKKVLVVQLSRSLLVFGQHYCMSGNSGSVFFYCRT